MKKFLKVVGVIVAVLVVLIGAIAVFSSGATDAADAVLAEFKAGNYVDVYNASAMTEEFTLEEFSASMGIDSTSSIATATYDGWTGRGFSGNQKYAYGDFTFPDGRTETLTVWFVDVDGDLLFSGITAGEPSEE